MQIDSLASEEWKRIRRQFSKFWFPTIYSKEIFETCAANIFFKENTFQSVVLERMGRNKIVICFINDCLGCLNSKDAHVNVISMESRLHACCASY